MKKIVLFLALAMIIPCFSAEAQASLISDRTYRREQIQNNRKEAKQIRELFRIHNIFANRHDLKNLELLYADNYISNDGFDKKSYFKSIEETWKECDDLTYTTKIISININGDYASVNVEETASGTISDVIETAPVAGEIHSKSTGIYYLVRKGDRWLISGENDLTDESSLLYGDARFMNIELQVPNQVSAGEDYTATVKIDADDDTLIVGSIDSDPVTYPSGTPSGKLHAVPKSQTLERIIKANTKNLNEYVISSLAISKIREASETNYKIYMSGLACIMKRVNVIPKNNYIKINSEDKVENDNM